MTKKVAISGYYGFKNFGDEAILSVLVRHLKNFDCDITVLSSDTEYTSSNYAVNSVNSFDISNIIKTLKNTNILISGGGSLLQDVTSVKSLIYYLLVIILAKLFGNKVLIFAQGIGPINNKIAKFFTLQILKKCNYISVRDKKSEDFLSKYGIKSDLLCDPIFSIDIEKAETCNTVGIQLREFPTLTEELLDELAKTVAKTFKDKKVEVFSLQDKLDFEICNKFKEKVLFYNSDIDCEVLTGLKNEEIISKISHLEYMIGMRFHALLIAIKAGVRTLGINYDIKVEKLANEAQIPLLSMDKPKECNDLIEELKNLNTENLKTYASAKIFDWTAFDNFL